MKNTQERFEDIKLYLTWDDNYYSPYFDKFYDAVIDFVIDQFDIAPGKMIMDAGCGPGNHTVRFVKRGFKCFSIDFSETAIAEAKRRVENEGFGCQVKFQHEDLTELSYPNESFSYIFCWGVIMHIPEPEKAIDEMSRILKHGGYLAISTNNANSIDKFLMRKIAYKFKRPKSLKKVGKSQMGRYAIFDQNGRELFVQGLFLEQLTRRFMRNGLKVLTCIGLKPTELYVHFKSEIGRKMFSYLTLVYFKYIRIPQFCADHLLIIKKP